MLLKRFFAKRKALKKSSFRYILNVALTDLSVY